LIGSCNPPSNLSVNVVPTGPLDLFDFVTWTWTSAPSSDNYQLQFREEGTTAWTTVNGVSSGTGRLYQGGDAGKTWEWRLRSNCTGGGFSGFINGPNFNT
jgi:hypothetical protein